MWTGNEDFHQQRCNHPSAFRIPGPLQLDLPDMEPPVEKGALISSYRGRIDSSKNHQQLPDFFFVQKSLVVWTNVVFRWGSPHQWRDSLHGNWEGERYKTLQGPQSRSRGKWNRKCHWGILTFCLVRESEKVQAQTEKWMRQLGIWVTLFSSNSEVVT